MLGLFLASCSAQVPSKEPVNPQVQEKFTWNFRLYPDHEVVFRDYVSPTQEEIDWFQLHFYDVLEKSANEYPIISVRQLLRAVLENDGGEYRILLSAQAKTLDAVASASHHDSGPEPTIMFYLRYLEDWYVYYDSEDYEDALIAGFLHEYRHTQQDWADMFEEPAPDWVTFGRESDAQWYVAENVLKPMREAGRLNSEAMEEYVQSLDAYLMAEGDQGDSDWQNHVQSWSAD